jgi:flagellin-like protein
MKGISPLIAAVLLIAFTVAIATLIMGWMSAYTRTTTSNVTSQSETAVECGSAAIKINHVYITGSFGSATGTVVVENTGFKDFTTVNALIASTNGSTCSTGSSTTLSKGEIKSITVGTDCPDASSFERAIVTTECGGVSDYTDKTSDLN